MKFKYVGDEHNPPTEIVAYGVAFPVGEAVDVSHLPEWQQDKIAGNWHFEQIEGAKKRGRPRKDATSQDE